MVRGDIGGTVLGLLESETCGNRGKVESGGSHPDGSGSETLVSRATLHESREGLSNQPERNHYVSESEEEEQTTEP